MRTAPSIILKRSQRKAKRRARGGGECSGSGESDRSGQRKAARKPVSSVCDSHPEERSDHYYTLR